MELIEKIFYRLSAQSRKKKFEQFMSEIKPISGDKIIDVGVNNQEYSSSDNYLEKHYFEPQNITAIAKDDISLFKRRYPLIKSIAADGKQLPFTENYFDIGYSNAVIEHVGNHQDQLNFLKELFRVSRRGYLTTPNRFFPVEIHTRIPLLHLILPKKIFDWFLSKIGKPWAAGNYMNLLSKKDLDGLFLGAGVKNYKIFKNRLFVFPATFSVIWDKSNQDGK